MSDRERLELDMKIRKLRNRRRKRRVWGKRLLTLSAAWVLSFGLFGISVVQGDSMCPAYKNGDVVCFLRVLPGGVHYGDVVILKTLPGWTALNGLRDFPVMSSNWMARGGSSGMEHPWRNGTPVAEWDVIYGADGSREPQTFTVPEGSCFYLVDNRPKSRDSRQTGCVAEKQIQGEVILTLRR